MSFSLEDIPFCDTFHPTWSEFQNFSEYLEKVTKQAKSGIFKVKLYFQNFRLYLQKIGKQERMVIIN
jgi:hypothetical protein